MSFLAFMVVATLLAGAAIMTDSQVLLIGAMVVGPEFGPLAGFCVAVVERRLRSHVARWPPSQSVSRPGSRSRSPSRSSFACWGRHPRR